MASSSSLSSLTLLLPSRPRTTLPVVPNKVFFSTNRRRRSFSVSASKKDSHGDGKLVDDSMVVLRMRIREMEMEEEWKKTEVENDRDGGGASSGLRWILEWERRCVRDQKYGSDVCEAVGMLQSVLMETRPCLAVGILVLVVMSVSVSVSLAGFHLVGLAEGIITSCLN